MWTSKDLSALDEVWIVFRSHHDVSIAFLSLLVDNSCITCHASRWSGPVCELLSRHVVWKHFWGYYAMSQIFWNQAPVLEAPIMPSGTNLWGVSLRCYLFLLGDRPFIVFYNPNLSYWLWSSVTGVYISLAFPSNVHHISCSRGRPRTIRETSSRRRVVQGRLPFFSLAVLTYDDWRATGFSSPLCL